MSWSDHLTSAQREELLTLRNLRHRTIQEVGIASLEVARTEDVLALAKNNLRTGQIAVRELEDRIVMRTRLFLGDRDDDFQVVDINDL